MSEKTKADVLRKTDETARREAKALIRTARFAALACLDPAMHAPSVSQVNVATDIDGAPGFLISSLSPHFHALDNDSRCAMLFGTPGKGDPAAHPRVSVMGKAQRLENPNDIKRVRRRFLARHPKSSLYVDFADFAFWSLQPAHASYNGGFGKAYEMTDKDILSNVDKYSEFEQLEGDAIEHMNSDHSDTVALYATKLLNLQPGKWVLAGIDSEGLDLTLGDKVARLWFNEPLSSANDVRPRLMQLAQQAACS